MCCEGAGSPTLVRENTSGLAAVVESAVFRALQSQRAALGQQAAPSHPIQKSFSEVSSSEAMRLLRSLSFSGECGWEVGEVGTTREELPSGDAAGMLPTTSSFWLCRLEAH